MLAPGKPDITILLLGYTLNARTEDVNLKVVLDIVAQLVTDLQAWPPEP